MSPLLSYKESHDSRGSIVVHASLKASMDGMDRGGGTHTNVTSPQAFAHVSDVHFVRTSRAVARRTKCHLGRFVPLRDNHVGDRCSMRRWIEDLTRNLAAKEDTAYSINSNKRPIGKVLGSRGPEGATIVPARTEKTSVLHDEQQFMILAPCVPHKVGSSHDYLPETPSPSNKDAGHEPELRWVDDLLAEGEGEMMAAPPDNITLSLAEGAWPWLLQAPKGDTVTRADKEDAVAGQSALSLLRLTQTGSGPVSTMAYSQAADLVTNNVGVQAYNHGGQSQEAVKLPAVANCAAAHPETCRCVISTQSSTACSDPACAKRDSKVVDEQKKFPVALNGLCDHHYAWARVRGKRKQVYFVCRECQVRWRMPSAIVEQLGIRYRETPSTC